MNEAFSVRFELSFWVLLIPALYRRPCGLNIVLFSVRCMVAVNTHEIKFSEQFTLKVIIKIKKCI